MKVQLGKNGLLQVLQKVQSIAEKKTNMPILSNILIKASEQQVVEFSATDLELSFWTQIPGQVETPGGVTVPARKLFEIVKELFKEGIVVEALTSGKMLVEAGRARFELPTLPPEDFPHLNFFSDLELRECDCELLKRCLSKTISSMPVEEDSFSIAGVYWHPLESGSSRFVSSDGHRLAYYETPEDSSLNPGNEAGIIIPRKGVLEILKVLEKETKASIAVHDKNLVLRTPTVFLSVQLLEADFPEYRLIIPEERPNSFIVDKDVFYTALKRVSVVTNAEWRHIRFAISKGMVELEGGSPEMGSANETFDVEYDGADFSVAFNVRYVMEAIQVIDGPQVRFEWVDDMHGGVFVGTEDPGYLSLVMPIVV